MVGANASSSLRVDSLGLLESPGSTMIGNSPAMQLKLQLLADEYVQQTFEK